VNDLLTAPIPANQMLLRLGLAVLAGIVVGYERESHGRAAGLRTTMLTCVAAAAAMILSTSIYEGASKEISWRPDPTRIAAGILTGIGFLGAGAIVREGKSVRGVTTAAVLWFVTILGLAFGAGHIVLGLLGLCVAMGTLFLLPSVEAGIKNDWYGVVQVTVTLDGMQEQEVIRRIGTLDVSVKKMDFDLDLEERRKTIRCEVKYKKGDLIAVSQRVVQELMRGQGVLRVSWS